MTALEAGGTGTGGTGIDPQTAVNTQAIADEATTRAAADTALNAKITTVETNLSQAATDLGNAIGTVDAAYQAAIAQENAGPRHGGR